MSLNPGVSGSESHMESSEREYERMSDGGSQMSGKSKTADVDAGDKLGDGSTSSATEPSGTIGSSILNLLNSVMGVGILALVRRCTSHFALRAPRSALQVRQGTACAACGVRKDWSCARREPSYCLCNSGRRHAACA